MSNRWARRCRPETDTGFYRQWCHLSSVAAAELGACVSWPGPSMAYLPAAGAPDTVTTGAAAGFLFRRDVTAPVWSSQTKLRHW